MERSDKNYFCLLYYRMSKSGSYQKTTSGVNPSTSASSISLNGTDLATAISDLVSANALEDTLLETCAFVNASNNFTGSNTFNVFIVPGVCTLNSSNDTNTISGKLNFINTVKFQTDVNVGKSDNTNIINIYGTTGLHGTTSFDSIPSTTTDLTSSITTNNQLTNKKYVDDSITNLKTASSTWTGANTFNNNVTLGNSNGSNTIQQYGALQLHGATVCDSLPSTATDLVASVTDDKHLAPKKYVDNKVNSLLPANNTFSGNNIFSGNNTMGSLVLTAVPTLNANYSQPSGNSLATKTYVDATVNIIHQTSYQLGYSTSMQFSGGNYILTSPRCGTGTTATTSSNLLGTVYLNFPYNNNFGPNSCIIDFYFYLTQCTAVPSTNAYSVGGTGQENVIYRTSPSFQASDFGLYTGYTNNTSSAPVTPINALIYLSIMNTSVVARQLSANINLMSSTGTTTSIVYSNTTIKYGSVLIGFTPIQVTYISQNKLRIDLYGPKMNNNPSIAGWVNSLGYSLKIKAGDVVNSISDSAPYFSSS
jgi:hypothetical protein